MYVIGPLHHMDFLLRLWTGLEFRFPDLVFFMKGRQIFFEESTETVDILLCSVEHKYGTYIAVPG